MHLFLATALLVSAFNESPLRHACTIHEGASRAIISPDASMIALINESGDDPTIKVFTLEGKARIIMVLCDEVIHRVQFTDNSSKLRIESRLRGLKDRVHVLDTQSGMSQSKYEEWIELSGQRIFVNRNDTIASWYPGKSGRVFITSKGGKTQSTEVAKDMDVLEFCALSPNGETLLICIAEYGQVKERYPTTFLSSRIELWDTKTNTKKSVRTLANESVYDAVGTEKGWILVTAKKPKEVLVWEMSK